MTTNLIDDEPGFDPRIRGTRIKIKLIAEFHNFGWDIARIVQGYPFLTHEQVEAALAYYFDHKDEIDQIIKADKKSIAEIPRLDLGIDLDFD
jgi:uncharacterized protein (DUF433 family)